MAWPSFLKKDGISIHFKGPGTMQFFIPQKLFTCGLASNVGEVFNVFGVFNYCLVDSKGKKGPLKLLNIPTRFLTNPSENMKMTGVKLTKNTPVQDYTVLTYKPGDQVIVETKVPQDIENVYDFMKLVFISGNVSNTIPYDKIPDLLMENIRINGSNYGVSAQLFGILFSECARSLSDPQKPFRLGGSKDMTEYDVYNVKKLARSVSTYSAFVTENFTESITAAAMNPNADVHQPLERVLTGD